jgi:hypothetical protein
MSESGTEQTSQPARRMSAPGRKAENISSYRVFRLLTQLGHKRSNQRGWSRGFRQWRLVRWLRAYYALKQPQLNRYVSMAQRQKCLYTGDNSLLNVTCCPLQFWRAPMSRPPLSSVPV